MASKATPQRPAVATYRVIRPGLGRGQSPVPVGTVFSARTDLHDFLTLGRWALLEDIGDQQGTADPPCSPTG